MPYYRSLIEVYIKFKKLEKCIKLDVTNHAYSIKPSGLVFF